MNFASLATSFAEDKPVATRLDALLAKYFFCVVGVRCLVELSICLYVWLSRGLVVYMHLSLPVCLFTCVFLSLPVFMSFSSVCVDASFSLLVSSTCAILSVYVYVSFSQSVYICLFFFLSVYMSFCV